MGQVDLVGAPGGWGRLEIGDWRLGSQGAAEDGELVAEETAVFPFQIAGIVPPFGLVVGVRAEVAGELDGVGYGGAGEAGGVGLAEQGQQGGLGGGRLGWLPPEEECANGRGQEN